MKGDIIPIMWKESSRKTRKSKGPDVAVSLESPRERKRSGVTGTL